MVKKSGKKSPSPGFQILKLSADAVRVEASLQQRDDGLDEAWVEKLTEVVKSGATFHERPLVFNDGSHYILARGFHRHAASAAAKKSIEYEVRPGTLRDAWLYAIGDNSGKPRSSSDIRKAIQSVLDDPEFGEQYKKGDLSHRQIAKLVCCDGSTVNEYIRSKTGAAPDPVKASAARMSNASRAEKKPETPEKQADPEPEGAGLPHLDQLGREIPEPLRQGWKAYCVCPGCDGHGDGCPSCGTSGVISDERAFFRLSPELRQVASQYGVQAPEMNPDVDGDDYVKRVEQICRDIDDLVSRVTELSRSPFARWMHIDSMQSAMKSVRKTAWQGRPILPCGCRKSGKVAHDCKVCGGCGRVSTVGSKASEVQG